MQDGQNLFFPEEAFLGQDWEVDKTSQTLRAMSAVEDFVIVGVYSDDRMRDYTEPGYEPYARSLAEEIVPEAQRRLRVGSHRRSRSVWGSSLGGVVSFYTVWQHPECVRHGRVHVEHVLAQEQADRSGARRARRAMSASISTAAGQATTTR